VKRPPSLRNILDELREDMGPPVPEGATLVPWAAHGVLLLNTVLTVRAGEAGSHAGHGWEQFTDAVIRAVANQARPVAFLLWGRRAQRKAALISDPPHVLIAAAHPSPLSARRGFLGSRPFSRANQALLGRERSPIDWNLASPAV
jgi:uracil-DNA glycosylase